MEGWIKIYRKITDNPIWTCESFTRGQAWVDLLLLANHEYGFFYCREHKIEVERGQVGWSEIKLADRWRWSRTKVRKFLNDLEKEQQVKQQKNHSYSIIEIINYDNYQEKEQQLIQQKNKRKTTGKQQQDTNKNDKNDKNDKEDIKALESALEKTKDFIDELIDNFSTQFLAIRGIEYYITNKGKERAAAGKILSTYKNKYPEAKAPEIKESLEKFFAECISQTSDNWLYENMSLSIIVSKLNVLNQILKNGQTRKSTPKSSATSSTSAITNLAAGFQRGTEYLQGKSDN